MVKLILNSNKLCISLHSKLLACSRKESQDSWNIETVLQNTTTTKTDEISIQCCSFSHCGSYLAVCYNKDLVVYETMKWEPYCTIITERKANSVKFFPLSSNILLADKSGVATFYTFGRDCIEKLDQIIGHNSMLTDALITDDEHYIVTCDRDEKIRVSNYPNTYNIESYCLGHEQFITGIDFLPSDKRILVSASGDGTVRLWNFVKGEQLFLFNKSLIGKQVPIVNLKCYKKENECSLAVIQEYKSSQILLLNVKGNLTNNLFVEILRTIEFSTIPWGVTLLNNSVLCFLSDKKCPLKICEIENSNGPIGYENKVTKYLSENWQLIEDEFKKETDIIPVLYKREIDNIQEYQEKKKARLLKNNEKN